MSSLKSDYEQLVSNTLIYPKYYLKPFHAYDEGNLSWQAAMEVESAALSVHSQIFNKPNIDANLKSNDKEKDKFANLNPEGDSLLRSNFHTNMLAILRERSVKVTRIVDIGCSTGLSTMKLLESFSKAAITGVDLSPYMLAGA
jgi:predicted O-methyltransferase YrrM